MTTLETAGPAHCRVIAAMHCACFAEASWDEAAVAEVLAMPGTFALIALEGDRPLGFVIARTAADEAEILSIGVMPGARRGGAARLLVAAAVRRAAEDGARRLFLEVATDNAAARAFYTETGFRPVGRRRGYYTRPGAPPADALVLELALGPV